MNGFCHNGTGNIGAACYALAEAEKDFTAALKKIQERYESIINGLNLTLSLNRTAFATMEPVISEPPLEKVFTLPSSFDP